MQRAGPVRPFRCIAALDLSRQVDDVGDEVTTRGAHRIAHLHRRALRRRSGVRQAVGAVRVSDAHLRRRNAELGGRDEREHRVYARAEIGCVVVDRDDSRKIELHSRVGALVATG